MKLVIPNIAGDIDLYMKVLRAICGDTQGNSMIDIGCCFAPNTPRLGFEQRLYIDVLPRVLDDESEQQHFQQLNILEIQHTPFKKDVAIASDLIEHLTVDDGQKLLSIMEMISHKQIIFTPLGELWMEKTPTSDPEAHRSAWYPEMFPGYASIVFPHYHKEWGVGAFFSWKCEDIEQDFERVKKLLNYG